MPRQLTLSQNYDNWNQIIPPSVETPGSPQEKARLQQQNDNYLSQAREFGNYSIPSDMNMKEVIESHKEKLLFATKNPVKTANKSTKLKLMNGEY